MVFARRVIVVEVTNASTWARRSSARSFGSSSSCANWVWVQPERNTHQPGEFIQNDIRAAGLVFEVVGQAVEGSVERIGPVVNLVFQVQAGVVNLVQGGGQEVILVGLDGARGQVKQRGMRVSEPVALSSSSRSL